jgi:hypothetical protein
VIPGALPLFIDEGVCPPPSLREAISQYAQRGGVPRRQGVMGRDGAWLQAGHPSFAKGEEVGWTPTIPKPIHPVSI